MLLKEAVARQPKYAGIAHSTSVIYYYNQMNWTGKSKNSRPGALRPKAGLWDITSIHKDAR